LALLAVLGFTPGVRGDEVPESTGDPSWAARAWRVFQDEGNTDTTHDFNAATKMLAAAAVESGRQNRLTTGGASLQVKMTTLLALSAGIPMTRNSSPPVSAKNTDTLSTLSLVYELKNPKLAAE
jgi:putative salt-induced outer membrane protein YdiY